MTASELKVRISADTSNVKKGLAETKKQVKDLSKDVKETTKQTKSQVSGLGKSLLKLAAVTHAFRKLTRATKDGINNIYEYSKAFNTMMSKDMDRLATAGLYFKNSLGALVAPIINIITPAVEYIVDKIVQAMNYISKTIAELTGQKTWTKAVYYQTEYKDSIDDTTKSANRLKATLLGIDELNLLTKDSGSGSIAKMGEDYKKMFEEVEIEGKKTFSDIWEDFVQRGNSKWALFAGAAASLLALKLGGAFEGLFAGAGAAGLLGKFTAVLLSAFGGFRLGNWLYYNIPGIHDWADDLMDNGLGQFIDNVIDGYDILEDYAIEWGDKILDAGEDAWNSFLVWLDKHDVVNLEIEVDKEKAKQTFQNVLDMLIDMSGIGKDNGKDNKKDNTNNTADPGGYNPNFNPGYDSKKPTFVSKETGPSTTTKWTKPIAFKAGGGFVDSGELFMARENGTTEMVGSIGNKTAVANNDQIVSALATANEGVIETLIQTNRMLISAIENKNMNVSISDEQIVRSAARGNNLYKRQTGVSLL